MMLNYMRSKHRDKTENRQSRIMSFSGTVGTCSCEKNRAEEISLLVTKKVTGDMFLLGRKEFGSVS